MFAEEKFLRDKFGDTYLEWSKDVPAFIPKLKNFKKSKLPFSWKKVVKKEKNGLFALFLIFCIFDLCGEIIQNGTDYNYFLMIMCIVTGFSYIVLKYLKKYTVLLNEENR